MINYSIIDGIEANEEVMVDEEVMKVEKINDEFPSEVIGVSAIRLVFTLISLIFVV